MEIFNLVLWLVVLFILSILSLPLANRINIIGLSKILGLIFVTYTVWLINFFTDFKLATVQGFLITVTIGSFLWLIEGKRIVSKFREIVIEFFKFELIFIIFFLMYITYELYNPYIFGAEKITDMAILTSITKSEGIPPYDPFLANYRLDCYYYMGYLSYAVLTVLSLSSTHISYNLACATVFALTMTAISWFIFQYREKIYIPFLLLSGNLVTLKMLLIGNLNEAFNFWTVTRVIKGTINEFPLATLFFRDLHPHFMSIPLQVAFLIALFLWVKENRKSTAIFLTFILGFMFTVNSWDFFTYAFIYILTSLVYRRFYALSFIPFSIIPFIPFHLSLNLSAVKGIGLVSYRSDVLSFILAQPLVLIPLVYSILEEKKLFAISLGITIPIAYFLNFPVLAITIPSLVVLSNKLYNDRKVEYCLLISALLILTAVEIFYVDDAYSNEIERLNTVFKTYIQAWIILSFGFIFSSYSYEKIHKLFTIILIAILWIYPIGCLIGLPTIGYKGTLDGIEFTKSYGEYNSLKFLSNFEGVVVEYPGKSPYESYTYAGRVSAYTGLRSVLSNGGHEYFWRFFERNIVEVLNERYNDVRSIYESESLNYNLLKKYNVTYIYIGYLEKRNYNVSYEKFSNLKKIYDDGNVVIYKVIYSSS